MTRVSVAFGIYIIGEIEEKWRVVSNGLTFVTEEKERELLRTIRRALSRYESSHDGRPANYRDGA
jgi:glycogen synthase